jgi:broad specificity phosphatase PhoE
MPTCRSLVLSSVLCLALAAPALAQGTVFLVRHAERADQGAGMQMQKMMGNDPDLSPAGQSRAESLAAMLKDAGITAIYTTQFKRTQQTAAPLAKALGLEVQAVSAADLKTLAARIAAENGNVLVVGHSNTVPDTIKALGVAAPVTIGDDEYDNLFIVSRAGGTPSVVRLRFR